MKYFIQCFENHSWNLFSLLQSSPMYRPHRGLEHSSCLPRVQSPPVSGASFLLLGGLWVLHYILPLQQSLRHLGAQRLGTI